MHAAAVRHEDAGEHAQQGALAGAVAADHAEALAAPQLQVDVLERPVAPAADAALGVERDADMFELDQHVAHGRLGHAAGRRTSRGR